LRLAVVAAILASNVASASIIASTNCACRDGERCG
jgi:hypothetical protein